MRYDVKESPTMGDTRNGIQIPGVGRSWGEEMAQPINIALSRAMDRGAYKMRQGLQDLHD